MGAIKVQELNKYIKKYLSMDYILSDIEVEGEISNFKHHSNGNMYLSLKDEKAKVNGIIYYMDTKNIDFSPQDGDKVIVRGTVSIYERDASLNIYIREMKLKGLGDLHEKFLRLKESLFKEGLFDEDNKKKIPYFPRTVGVITSKTGAAIRDIINVLTRRNNSVNIIIYPANVQGDKASEQLKMGIKYFNENPVDVIILGRGGGGYEDLFAFNDEELAREIYKSNIPIISAVGHEIDFVISDFVSDLRAPTPSAAAEIVTMEKSELINSLNMSVNRMNQKVSKKIETKRSLLDNKKFILDNLLEEKIKDNLELLKLQKRLLDYNKPTINTYKLDLINKDKLLRKSFYNKIKSENNNLKNTFYDLNKAFENKYKYELLNFSFQGKRLMNNKPYKNFYKEKEQLENLKFLLDNNMKYMLNTKKLNLSTARKNLTNPVKSNVLIRDENNNIVSRAKGLKEKDNLRIIFEDGNIETLVNKVFLRRDTDE